MKRIRESRPELELAGAPAGVPEVSAALKCQELAIFFGASSPSRPTTPSFPVTSGYVESRPFRQCNINKNRVLREKANADAITNNGRMPSSPIWGFSRCPKLTDWRANPDAETTDWRARCGRTAHRVRREGTAISVPYPYPSARTGHSRASAFREGDCRGGPLRCYYSISFSLRNKTSKRGSPCSVRNSGSTLKSWREPFACW